MTGFQGKMEDFSIEGTESDVEFGPVSAIGEPGKSEAFEGSTVTMQPDLLRGVGLGNILSCGPKLLSQNDLQDRYHLSETLENLDMFISHTWRSNRVMKYFVLLYVYNGELALKTGYCVAFATFAIALALRYFADVEFPFVHLPCPGHVVGASLEIRQSFVCVLCGGLAQILVLFLGHTLPRRSISAFFDKVCISQTDPELKAKGIQAIGSILEKTDEMLMIYDTDYCERLWCIFEIAAFSRTHGFQAIAFRPLILGLFTVGMAIVCLVGCMSMIMAFCIFDLLHIMQGKSSWPAFLAVWTVPGTVVWWAPKFWVCWSLVCGRKHMLSTIPNFSVRDAKVRDEKDREFVESHIISWYGSLDSFDMSVRTGLLKTMKQALGPDYQAVPYKAIIFENSSIFFALALDGIIVLPWQSDTLAAVLKCVILACGELLVFHPLFIFASCCLARVTIGLHRSAAAVSWVVMIPILGLWWPLWFATVHNTEPYISGSMLIAGAVAVFLIYRSA